MAKITQSHVAYIVTLERQGRTTAEDILTDAKRPDSPLHDLYDWDVTKAAESHWLDRTRQIIRFVRIVVHTQHQTIRIPRYIRDPSLHGHEQGYVSVERVRLEEQLAYRALVTELERVTSSLRRARAIATGVGLEGDIDELLARVAGLRTMTTAQTSAPTPSAEGDQASTSAA
jgi:hypothetical protein